MSDIIPLNQSPGFISTTDSAVTTAFTPGTDFKAVAIGAGANVEGFPAYFNDPLLVSGNLPGIAISSFNNRALRQGTFVASSLCLWISGQIQQYIPDDGDQIHWMSEWQNALSNFVLALIPPGPNLGAYLPLAGGTMVGNIQFQAGISTVLANNTWYFGRDTGGQARGLIIKASDNNIYINDGTASYVFIGSYPTTNNNYMWCGRTTGGGVIGLIGLMSDNQIHIGGGVGEVYFDNNGSVHSAGNYILANNRFIYGNDTGGTPRALIGTGGDNSAYISSGTLGATHIYAGSWIYLRQNTNALGQVINNGATYMNGRGQAYQPGGNDPFTVYSDNGYYARAHFISAGTRDWTVGCLNNGPFGIADESAAAMRLQIDTGGTVSIFNYLSVGGGIGVGGVITGYQGANITGNLGVGNAAYIYNTCSVWNGLWINSGNLNAGGAVLYCAGVSTGGAVQGGWLYSTGDALVNNNMTIAGWLQVNNNIGCNTFSTNHISDNGDLTMQGNFWTASNVGVNNHLTVQAGFCMGAYGAYNFDYTLAFPVNYHAQWVSGVGVYAQFFGSYSDERLKRNIVDADHDALGAIKAIKFYSYDVPRNAPSGEEVIDESSHVDFGFMAQQVRESLPGVVRETDQPVKFVEGHDKMLADGGAPAECHFETQSALAIDTMTMLAYSLRAIQQLTARLEQLEGRA